MARVSFLRSGGAPAGGVRRALLPVGLALVLGAGAWFFSSDWLKSGGTPERVAQAPSAPVAQPPPPVPEPAPPPPVLPSVLVIKRDVTAGVLLSSELLEWREWIDPVDMNMAVVQGVVPQRAVIGAVTLQDFAAGAMVAWDGILVPGQPGFISAALTPGMRAVTVEVDRATTDANIIYPGDRVDIILVAGAGRGGGDMASRTIAWDSRVLAVGSTVLALGRYGKVSITEAGQVEPVPPPDGANYTLEVGPRDAERIAIGASVGRLTLAMRAVGAPPEAAGRARQPVRFAELMPPPPEPAPAAPPPPPKVVRILRGTATQTATMIGDRT